MMCGIQNIGEISLFIKQNYAARSLIRPASNPLQSNGNMLFVYLWVSFLQKIFQNAVNVQLLCARKFLDVIWHRQLVPDLQLKYAIKLVITHQYNTSQKYVNSE